ncbi:DEAD/DEAH box helicase [Cephaloticoccus primus]|uniref:DEAD/DEAH box helicase n=1 Tax=Cephaloticoccus primus TaxID=1548207 RepID=UPI0012E71894|nr:DEAD/DEAH box helicase [Cephaloticoccus primus]
MHPHATKRIYTPQSLEFWFEKLGEDWSNTFKESQLENGRRLYREGQVRELELTAGEAIIHRRIDKRDEYALIEWEPSSGGRERLHVRSSTTDLEEARALAVAGLHEIEELIADEIPATADDSLEAAAPERPKAAAKTAPDAAKTPAPNQPSPALRDKSDSLPAASRSGATPQVSAAATTAPPASPAPSAPENRSNRELLLDFKVTSAGLSFQAYWLEADGARQPALGASANSGVHVSSAERAKLIGLAAYARKAHLLYDQASGVYLMESLVEIPRFLKTTLPAWEKLFRVEIDARAEHLRHGTRSIDIEGIAQRSDSGGGGYSPLADKAAGATSAGSRNWRGAVDAVEGINLRWIFRVGERLLSPGEVRTVLKSEGKPVLLPNFGVVAIEPEKLSAYKTFGPKRSLATASAAQAELPSAASPKQLGEQHSEEAGRATAPNEAANASSARQSGEGGGEPELPPYLIFSLFNEAGLKLTLSPELEAWRQRLLAAPPPAADLPELLRPYQRRGVEWLAHLGELGCHGLLADEMGLGKTLQVITLLSHARRANEVPFAAAKPLPNTAEVTEADARPTEGAADSLFLRDGNGAAPSSSESAVDAGNATRPDVRPAGARQIERSKDLPSLIVCPASVVPVWQEEIARFAPELRTAVLKGSHDFVSDRRAELVWIASYTQLRKHREQLAHQSFDYAVLDEGQFIKNPDAKVSQTCWEICARRRIVLTGTPLENRQLDLWSLFRFLLPGLLGTRASFEAALASDRVGTTERLRAQLAPFILRRTKREVATELPQKVEMELLCPLSDVQKAEYARTCAEGLERLGDDMAVALREKSFGFLALLTRLRQTCCDPDLLPWRSSPLSDSGKLMLLVEKLAEVIESGHKVVIFSQFVKLLDRVKAALDVHHPLLPRFELTGGTLDRQRPVQEFQNAVGAAAMLVSLKAAGTGITLHAADYVFLLDPWWNPAVEAQAVDRVHRIGQENTVFVYRMVTAGTIEERIQDLKAEKKELFDKLLGGTGADIDLGAHFDSLRSLVELGASVGGSDSATLGAAGGASAVGAGPSAGGPARLAENGRAELRAAGANAPRPSGRLDLAALAATMSPDELDFAAAQTLPAAAKAVAAETAAAGPSPSAELAPATAARVEAQQSELDFLS